MALGDVTMSCHVEEKDGKMIYKLDQTDVDRYIQGAPEASHLIGMLQDYVERRWWPGDCLGGMLENDLKKFFSHADTTTVKYARHIFRFVYNVLPQLSWGSPEEVKAFMEGTELC